MICRIRGEHTNRYNTDAVRLTKLEVNSNFKYKTNTRTCWGRRGRDRMVVGYHD